MNDRLPSCTARDVDRALKRGGFRVVHQKGTHRYYTLLVGAAAPISLQIIGVRGGLAQVSRRTQAATGHSSKPRWRVIGWKSLSL